MKKRKCQQSRILIKLRLWARQWPEACGENSQIVLVVSLKATASDSAPISRPKCHKKVMGSVAKICTWAWCDKRRGSKESLKRSMGKNFSWNNNKTGGIRV